MHRVNNRTKARKIMFVRWVKLVRAPKLNRKSKQSGRNHCEKWRFEFIALEDSDARGKIVLQSWDRRRWFFVTPSQLLPLHDDYHTWNCEIIDTLRTSSMQSGSRCFSLGKAWLIRLTLPSNFSLNFAAYEKVFDFNATLLRFSRSHHCSLCFSRFSSSSALWQQLCEHFSSSPLLIERKTIFLCFFRSDDVLFFFLLSEELESINNCVMSAPMLAIVFVIFCLLSKRHFYGWETSPGSTKHRETALCRLNNNGPGLTRLRTPAPTC